MSRPCPWPWYCRSRDNRGHATQVVGCRSGTTLRIGNLWLLMRAGHLSLAEGDCDAAGSGTLNRSRASRSTSARTTHHVQTPSQPPAASHNTSCSAGDPAR
jgi:hypothetical protein